MKFNPTLQQLALIVILLAAIPLTYAFVAPAAGVVTGMVSTLVGAFFVDRKTLFESAPSAPVLKIVPKDDSKEDDA